MEGPAGVRLQGVTPFAQDWYNKDKGASLEVDFIELLS